MLADGPPCIVAPPKLIDCGVQRAEATPGINSDPLGIFNVSINLQYMEHFRFFACISEAATAAKLEPASSVSAAQCLSHWAATEGATWSFCQRNDKKTVAGFVKTVKLCQLHHYTLRNTLAQKQKLTAKSTAVFVWTAILPLNLSFHLHTKHSIFYWGTIRCDEGPMTKRLTAA